MGYQPSADASDAGTPVSVEVALRRVRLLTGALVLARLWSEGSIPHAQAVLLVASFWSINVVARIAQRQPSRDRMILGVVQVLADTMFVLVAVSVVREQAATSADWAVLVLPAIEGAIRFGIVGAIGSWLVLAGGYTALDLASTPTLPGSTIAQRLTVVLLVAMPVGYLADRLVAEITGHRLGRDQAEQRSVLLRAAALGGRRTSRLDVDGVLDVIRATVADLGFTEPQIFELCGEEPTTMTGVSVRGSRPGSAIAPGDPLLLAAAAAEANGTTTIWPPGSPAGDTSSSTTLVALEIPMIRERVAVTARWPEPAPPPDAQVESLELFAAQAGASLRNAQIHRGLEQLKDRLDHEASHDPLTGLANRRRFTEELERNVGRGRPEDRLGVLFLDLDGFKEVNDRYGHGVGNDLLVEVASRLRACVRPGDLVARMGGDEFTIMLTRLTSVAPATAVADRICSSLAAPFRIGPEPIRISTSVGIAVDAAHHADVGDLMRRADAAMYRAKTNGKAGWTIDPHSLEPATGDDPGA